MNFGYFDNEAREYVITNPKTPTKWINYIGTLAFGGFVDHTGGAALCKGDPGLNRITWYTPQLPASTFKATTLYLRFPERKRRFAQNQGYKVFSPFFVPTLDAYDLYECHVGLGYTRIVSEFYGIRTEATIFVPNGATQEVRDIRITNISGKSLNLDAIPLVEYSCPEAIKQFNNNDWVPQIAVSQIVEDADGQKILLQYPFMFRDIKNNFLTSNLPATSFTSDRSHFLGAYEYGTWANPLSLQQPELDNYVAQRGHNVGALMYHLDELQPGETRRLITQLGQAESVEAALPSIRRYRDPSQVDAALDEMTTFWDKFLSHQQVHTPDPAMNAMLNIHNPRQTYITLNWSRYLSLYQVGLGARGIGFRDSSQDITGVVPNAPDEARALMEKLLQVQTLAGSAMHQFYPLSMEGSVGDSAEMEDRPKFYGDDHLWIVLAATAYLKETGDFAFLDKVLPFYDKDKDGQPLESGTVLEHLKRSVTFTHDNTGVHGLPLLGFADWNDSTNLRAGAESLFNANLYGWALRELVDLFTFLDNTVTADAFQTWYDEMRDLVNEHAWDGAWYVRYFDYDGTPLGSHINEKTQIVLNGQSWPVLSGFAKPERAVQALNSAYERLNTRNGLKASTPSYNGYDPNKGGVTTYPPGTKENGSIFLHTNPWMMIAETIIGRGDRAYQYYCQINPAARNDRMEEFESDPYAYPQNMVSDEHPQFGLARNSWLTGTASWTYQAGTKYILGVRPTYEGLLIDPCIPAEWDGFTVRRTFRSAVYKIEVTNPDHICKGVKSVLVDGEAIEGQVVPIFEDGTHQIVVGMG